MSAREFREWQEFYKLEPFGEERADLRAAIVAATMANIWRDKSAEPVEVSAFMPKFGAEEETEEVPDWQRMLAMAEAMTAMMGGTDLRPKGE